MNLHEFAIAMLAMVVMTIVFCVAAFLGLAICNALYRLLTGKWWGDP